MVIELKQGSVLDIVPHPKGGYFNPLYVVYSLVNGNLPNEQLEVDTTKYPGGCMVGFTSYVQKKLREFKDETGLHDRCRGYLDMAHHWIKTGDLPTAGQIKYSLENAICLGK